jgi:putative phosphoesterase
MKIAILSDIHANLYALQAVIELIKKQNINKLFVLGDMIGYYYQPKQVLSLLKEFDTIYVKGNHEQMLEDVIQDTKKQPFITQKYGNGIEIAIKDLTKDDIKFLTTLPKTQTIEVDKIKILLCHGSPWDTNFYLYPDAAQEQINKFDNYEFDYIFFGHTHYPVIFEGTNKKIINPGSVGQSRVQGGIANFGILDTTNNIYLPQHTVYNRNIILKEVAQIDPEVLYLTTILTRNNPL